MYSTFRYESADGTTLLGWTNNGEGPTVLVCNGLGVPPEAWPRLLDPNCGYRVFGYNHRGGLGSDKPADRERIRIDDHVADAFALMDLMGLDKVILLAWSYGVNISFEITKRAPDRVAGLVMCAGVPGGTLEAAFAPLMVPRPLRKPLGLAAARIGEFISPQLNVLARTVPKNRLLADFLRNTRVIMPTAKSEDVVAWMEAFAAHDFAWYFHMFPAAGEHEPIDPTFVQVPITVAAGGLDALTSMRDVVGFAEQIEHAEIHVLQGTHFLPLEFPDEIMAMLDGVLERSELADQRIHEPRESVIDVRIVAGQTFFDHEVQPSTAT